MPTLYPFSNFPGVTCVEQLCRHNDARRSPIHGNFGHLNKCGIANSPMHSLYWAFQGHAINGVIIDDIGSLAAPTPLHKEEGSGHFSITNL